VPGSRPVWPIDGNEISNSVLLRSRSTPVLAIALPSCAIHAKIFEIGKRLIVEDKFHTTN
jgi:hypothetical protein